MLGLMLEAGEALRLILAALGLGALLPVMIQLYLTIREIRHTVRRLSDQVEPSLRQLREMAERRREPQPATAQVGTLVAALIPALVAAYGAFRQHQNQAAEGPPSDLATNASNDNE